MRSGAHSPRSKTIDVGIMVHRKHSSIAHRKAAEMDPTRDPAAAIEKLSPGLHIQRFEHRRTCIEQTLVFSAPLYRVLAGSERKQHAIRDHGGIGNIEISGVPRGL